MGSFLDPGPIPCCSGPGSDDALPPQIFDLTKGSVSSCPRMGCVFATKCNLSTGNHDKSLNVLSYLWSNPISFHRALTHGPIWLCRNLRTWEVSFAKGQNTYITIYRVGFCRFLHCTISLPFECVWKQGTFLNGNFAVKIRINHWIFGVLYLHNLPLHSLISSVWHHWFIVHSRYPHYNPIFSYYFPHFPIISHIILLFPTISPWFPHDFILHPSVQLFQVDLPVLPRQLIEVAPQLRALLGTEVQEAVLVRQVHPSSAGMGSIKQQTLEH